MHTLKHYLVQNTDNIQKNIGQKKLGHLHLSYSMLVLIKKYLMLLIITYFLIPILMIMLLTFTMNQNGLQILFFMQTLPQKLIPKQPQMVVKTVSF